MGENPIIKVNIKENTAQNKWKNNLDEIENRLETEKRRKQAELDEIIELSSHYATIRKIDAQNLDFSFLKGLYKYIYRAEENFLETRLLYEIISLSKNSELTEVPVKGYLDRAKIKGNLDKVLFFIPEIIKGEGYLRIKLPKMPQTFVKNVNTYTRKYIGELTKAFIEKAYNEKLFKRFEYDNSLVIFDHHQPYTCVVPDADNYDTKVVLDALNGICFHDDNLKNISVCHISSNDGDVFTYVYIVKNGAENLMKMI